MGAVRTFPAGSAGVVYGEPAGKQHSQGPLQTHRATRVPGHPRSCRRQALTPTPGMLTLTGAMLTPTPGMLTLTGAMLTPTPGMLTPTPGMLMPTPGLVTRAGGMLTPTPRLWTPTEDPLKGAHHALNPLGNNRLKGERPV